MEFHDKIKNHMNTTIVYTTEHERLADVIFKMSQAKTDIAVVKTKDTLQGIITESDIYYALVHEVFPQEKKKTIPTKDLNNLTVIDLMRGPPAEVVMASCESYGWHPCIDVFEDDPLENAILVIQRSGVHHLLVLDKENNLVGTLSSGDIIKGFGTSVEQK
jgi:CBS domain-containing protein